MMQDVLTTRTAFEERVEYPRTGRVVIRKFDNAFDVVPSDIIILAKGNEGKVPPISPLGTGVKPIKPVRV